MRFLSMIRVQENTGMQPSERMMSEMGKLMTEMKSAGKLLDTAGLAPTAQSKRVRLRGGKISVVDGPFTETKEVVGGYAMLNAHSLEEAIALTERFVELHVADGWESIVKCGTARAGLQRVVSVAIRLRLRTFDAAPPERYREESDMKRQAQKVRREITYRAKCASAIRTMALVLSPRVRDVGISCQLCRDA
jgi:hypothetical protein